MAKADLSSSPCYSVLNVQKEKISLSALQEAKEAKESIDTLQLKLKEKTEQLEQSMHTKNDLMQQRYTKSRLKNEYS